MRPRIVLLLSKTILAQGIIHRFEQLDAQVELHRLDPLDDDLWSKIVKLQPAMIVLDSDALEQKSSLLNNLVVLFPTIKIAHLSTDQSRVCLISSEQKEVRKITDLLALLAEEDGEQKGDDESQDN